MTSRTSTKVVNPQTFALATIAYFHGLAQDPAAKPLLTKQVSGQTTSYAGSAGSTSFHFDFGGFVPRLEQHENVGGMKLALAIDDGITHVVDEELFGAGIDLLAKTDNVEEVTLMLGRANGENLIPGGMALMLLPNDLIVLANALYRLSSADGASNLWSVLHAMPLFRRLIEPAASQLIEPGRVGAHQPGADVEMSEQMQAALIRGHSSGEPTGGVLYGRGYEPQMEG